MDQDFYNYQFLYLKRLQDLYDALSQTKHHVPPSIEAFQASMMQVGVKFWNNVWAKPDHMMEAQKRYMEMLQSDSPVHSSYERYFKSDFWNSSPFFHWVKDIYLKTAEWLIQTIQEEALGFNEDEREKLLFLTRQWVEGINPRNFPLTNPDVIQEMINTKGENFLRGMDNLIRDIKRGAVSMTDEAAYKVGENIATTAGSVIYRNHMMELIQYAPTTKTVFQEPVLIVPPWINKYYILDLTADNSYIKWLVDQGHTVFCISWINPDESYRDVAFKDYMHDGVLQAMQVAGRISGSHDINMIGYCIGGTLLAMTMAWLEGNKNKEKSVKIPGIKTATFLTTLLDFEQAGDLRVFIDKDQVQSLNQSLIQAGVMDGKAMAMTFALLRASDLIWSFVINNYFLGRDPVPFDLLYWNSDSTNLPAAMHCDYLTSLYLENRLADGNYRLDGVQLDLTKIKTPAYFLSTREDHIAPWKATKAGADLYGGTHQFVLAGSGHIAGVINPPHKNKYGFEVDEKQYTGSWWPHWQEWIKAQNIAELIPAPMRCGSDEYKMLADAPGTYVLKKL